MKPGIFIALLLVSAFAAGSAAAQPAPFNATGVTFGHWHLASTPANVEANKKIFFAIGGRLFMPGGAPVMMFPGTYINLTLNSGPGSGETVGSVVNRVGFAVPNVQAAVSKWKAAGVPVFPGDNNRMDQAFVVTPDGLRIEILEDKAQTMPIRSDQVHLFLTEAEIPKAEAWYAKTFGGIANTRANEPVVDVPGSQIRFAKVPTAQAPTKGRILDHIGFDVNDLPAFARKIEAEGIKLDQPLRTPNPGANNITYITDPWGTRIELIQRAPLGPEVTN